MIIALFCLAYSIAPAHGGTISGTIRYTDRLVNSSGFTGAVRYLPIPYARVEIDRIDGTAVNIGSTNTDINGAFSITFTALELPASKSFQIRLFSETTNSNPDPVKVVTLAGAVHSIQFTGAGLVTDASGDWTGSVGSFDAPSTLTVSEANGGPFNILFCVSHAAGSVAALEGGVYPPQCTVRWQIGSTTGTYTESNSMNIYLLGDTTRDTDEHDDTVIVHEYGHFVSYNYTQDDSPGGYHYGAVTDLRLAWMEAWSGYFASWCVSEIETWIAGAVVYDSVYVDTRASGAASWNIEPPSAAGFPGMYDNDEISIQSGLWDIYDPANESWDIAFTFTGGKDGRTAVWEVYRSLKTLPQSTQVTFEDFWSQWFALGFANKAAMDSIFLGKLGIDLYPDAFENNDTAGTATQLTIGDPAIYNTFAPAGDQDWFKFNVESGKSYSVATSDLINGADTMLTVYNSTVTSTIGTNDNRSSTTRESLVQFTATYTGPVYVKVTQVTSRTYAQLGGYKIAVILGSGTVDPPDPTDSGGGSGGCFIATAAFGAISQSSVIGLTMFRDSSLDGAVVGGSLVGLYYAASPSVASAIVDSPAARATIRSLLSY